MSGSYWRCLRRLDTKGESMKKIVVLSGLALGLAGWLAPGVASASNGAQIQVSDVIGETLVNPCNGETVTITSGTFQIVVHETAIPGGYHLNIDGNARGVKGVSASGANYQVPGGFWTTTNATPGAQMSTDVGVFNLVGQAGAPNFRTFGVLHVTVTANGDVTASIDHQTATCTP